MLSLHTLLPALLAMLAGCLLLPAAAGARVVIVAGGDGAATLTNVSTNRIAARIPVGGRSRAAAASPDGSRGYVAAGNRVVALDLTPFLPAGEAALPAPPTAPAASADGPRLFARPRGPRG